MEDQILNKSVPSLVKLETPGTESFIKPVKARESILKGQ
jgi:hypothetical protein